MSDQEDLARAQALGEFKELSRLPDERVCFLLQPALSCPRYLTYLP